MAFQLKDFVSIVASMINRAKATQNRLTDFEVGSVARTLIEAPAIEIEQFYQRMFAGIMDAIPVSIYRGFKFSVADPVKARGTVVITFGTALETAVVIPAGTVFIDRTTTKRYLAVAEVTAPIGATTADVIVDAANVGSSYNVGSGQITVAANLRLPVGSTISNTAILTGSDGETDTERAARFLAYIQSISRATTVAVKYAAGTAVLRDAAGDIIEYVSRVDLVEEPGYVELYIYGSEAPPSAALIAEAQHIVDGYYDRDLGAYVSGYRPIGVDVAVLAMAEQPLSMVVSVDLESGYTLDSAMTDAVVDTVAAVLADVHAGDTLYVDALRNAVLGIIGVSAVLVSLTENYLCPANVVLVAGTISVVALEIPAS